MAALPGRQPSLHNILTPEYKTKRLVLATQANAQEFSYLGFF